MIGVFDSGIGGLTVVRALMRRLPEQDIVYLGDTARTPYGCKSPATIIKYSLNNTDFLLRQGADHIVIACNTASSHAYDDIRNRFRFPVFEVIRPGARLAVQHSRHKRIGVIGTRATIASGVYEQTIGCYDRQTRVYAMPCPLLVPLVEEGWVSKPATAMILRKYLRPLKCAKIDTLILGCTHYPVLRSVIQRKMGPRVALIDSAEAVAAELQTHLQAHPGEKDNEATAGRCRIYVTDTSDHFQKIARLILRRPVSIELADL